MLDDSLATHKSEELIKHEGITSITLVFKSVFLLAFFFFNSCLNSQEVAKIAQSHVRFTWLLLTVISYLAIVQYENQEIGIITLLFTSLWTLLSFL